MTESEEEILVLKSIFNDDILSLDRATFDIIIRFHSLFKPIRLIDEEANTSTELTHLPPIILRISIKETYPERNPPDYHLSCDYLTSKQLFSLTNQLDSLWKAGELIVFTWIEFLKDYFCQINNPFLLSSMESIIDDQRFSTNYEQIGSKRIYEQLIEYNRMENQFEFDQTNHLCPICLDEKSCLQFQSCHHYACISCLNSHAKEHLLNMQQRKQITCHQCDAHLSLSEVRRIFSDEKYFRKYQEHLVDMISCPRCHHSIVCLPSESVSGNHPSFVECLYCQLTFCRRCEESWHPQIQCPKEKIIREIIENPAQFNRIELKKLLLEIESIQTIEQCSKPCPSCNVRIEKNGGCQHMNCRACQIHFCWLCGWSGSAYGLHPCAPKAEKLDVLSSREVEEKVLHDEEGKVIHSEVIKRVQICPRPYCQEVHVKIGTKNMIICSKCQKCFCFVCGEAVYGLFHYSEYGCKANTTL